MRKPTCSKCGKVKEKAHATYCKACNAEYARAHRPPPKSRCYCGFTAGDTVLTPTKRRALLTRFRVDERWDAHYLTRDGTDTGEPTILDPRQCVME